MNQIVRPFDLEKIVFIVFLLLAGIQEPWVLQLEGEHLGLMRFGKFLGKKARVMGNAAFVRIDRPDDCNSERTTMSPLVHLVNTWTHSSPFNDTKLFFRAEAYLHRLLNSLCLLYG